MSQQKTEELRLEPEHLHLVLFLVNFLCLPLLIKMTFRYFLAMLRKPQCYTLQKNENHDLRNSNQARVDRLYAQIDHLISM